jgi:hypothetical protein
MRIRRNRVPRAEARVGDMVATQEAEHVGIVSMLLRNPGNMLALMSRRPREELAVEFGRDTLMQDTILHLVFVSSETEIVNKHYARKLHHFQLFEYGDSRNLVGNLTFRVFAKNCETINGKAHRRIESISLRGEEVYRAPGV